jgi:hypothetical protein
MDPKAAAMAEVDAPFLVGESIAALLRARRALLAQAGQLGAIPATQDIAHVPVATLVAGSAPSSGLSLTCYFLSRTEQPRPVAAPRSPGGGIGVALELHYLLASWGSTASDELTLLSWAMLELARYPQLGPGQLLGNGWDRAESIMVVPGSEDIDQVERIWSRMQLKYRLSTTFRARIVRIGYGPPAGDALPVVASRFNLADGDVALEPAL